MTMDGRAIARQHFEAAIREAAAAGFDADSVARCMLDCVVAKYLELRPAKDVCAELQFVAENCDPDTDFMFMRP